MNEITKIPETKAMEPVSNAGALLNIIERAAFDPAVDIARLELLFEMQRKVLADEARVAFEQAMTQAQAEMEPVAREAQNTHTKAKYARLEDIDAAIRPVYTRHGLSLSFNQQEAGAGSVSVSCKVGHARGHFESYTLTGGLDNVGAGGNANKTPIQALGSSVSYLRRYLTCMIFNIALKNEDNDGNAQSKAHLVRINAEQKGEILRLIKELADAGIETASFYEFIRSQMSAEAVDDLKVADYPRVITALKNKIKQAGVEA